MATPPAPPPAARGRPGSSRGAWTIAAIFGLGFAVLAGLCLSPRGAAPPVPAGLAAGLPDRPVTGAVLDCKPLGPSPLAVVASVRALGPTPDLLFLVDLEADLVPGVVESLGLQQTYHPQLYQRARPAGDKAVKVGVCVLSPHPTYAGRAVRPTEKDLPVGVAATIAVDGRAIGVACVDLAGPAAEARLLAVRNEPTAGVGRPAVVAGRIGGQLFVESTGGRDKMHQNATTAAASEPGGSGGPVEMARRQAEPPAVVFRLVRSPTAATRPD